MFSGQSREEFSEYLEKVCENGKHCPLPAGATFYTSLNLTGLQSPYANEPGDNHQDMWFLTRLYKPLDIQVGLWLGADQLKEIIAGKYSRQIDQLGNRLGELKSKVYLRIGYEFDGPHNRYDPEEYKQAYRIIAKRLRQETNIILVWHSFALNPTYLGYDVMEWYPGDQYVDWLGVSYFQVDKEGFYASVNRARILEIARQKNKPVMIAEASAIRYLAKHKSLSGTSYWNYWYKPFFDFIEGHDEIKAVCIINVNWDSQRQHAVLSWGDSRINADKFVLNAWRKKMKEKYWVFSRAGVGYGN